MSFMFSTLRRQGGICRKREDTLDSMGITWDDYSQRRSEMLELLKDDVDTMLDNLCQGTHFSTDSIGIPRRRKQSIQVIPTIKTPGIIRRRPLQQRAEFNPSPFKSPSTRSKTRPRISPCPLPTIIDITDSPENQSPPTTAATPTCNLSESESPDLPPSKKSKSVSSSGSTDNSPSFKTPICVSKPSVTSPEPTNGSPTCTVSATSSKPNSPEPNPTITSPHPQSPIAIPVPHSPTTTTRLSSLSKPRSTPPTKCSPLLEPEPSSESIATLSINETFVISITDNKCDDEMEEQQLQSSSSRTSSSSNSSNGAGPMDTNIPVDEDNHYTPQDEGEPLPKQKNDGMLKKWNELMNSAIKEHHQQRLKIVDPGVRHGMLPVRNSPVKAAESQQLRKQRLAEKIAEKAEREAARQRELQLKKEQERSERVRKREERMKRIADNQAALQEKEKKKLKKIQEGKNVVKEKQRKENLKLKERQLAAEQRRQEQERLKKLKLKEIEEERRLVEELHAKRMKLEEEERQKKKEEKAEIEKERLRRKDGEERKKPVIAVATTSKKKSPEKLTKQKKPSPLEKQKEPAPPPAVAFVPPPLVAAPPKTAQKPLMSSKYQDVSTYNITPMETNPLLEADNYNIDELASDESSDDEDDPKKAVPMWAAPINLLETIKKQETEDALSTANDIFPPEELLQSPNLAKIFPQIKRRFFKRTSSAQWSSPMLKKK